MFIEKLNQCIDEDLTFCHACQSSFGSDKEIPLHQVSGQIKREKPILMSSDPCDTHHFHLQMHSNLRNRKCDPIYLQILVSWPTGALDQVNR